MDAGRSAPCPAWGRVGSACPAAVRGRADADGDRYGSVFWISTHKACLLGNPGGRVNETVMAPSGIRGDILRQQILRH